MKRGGFTREKRVKAVARKRVGAPKPARVLDERVPRTKTRKASALETVSLLRDAETEPEA